MSPSDAKRMQAAIRASRYLGIAPWDLLQRPEWLAACLVAIDTDRHHAACRFPLSFDGRPMPPPAAHRSIRSLFSDPSPPPGHEEPTDGYDDTSGA